MQKFVGSFLSTVMERRCLWGALQMEVLGSFQIKSSKTSKPFFNQPMKLTLSVMMFFQRKYQKLRSFCTMKCSLPIFPKNHQSWSADCLCGYRYKNYEQFKKLWLLNLHKNKTAFITESVINAVLKFKLLLIVENSIEHLDDPEQFQLLHKINVRRC